MLPDRTFFSAFLWGAARRCHVASLSQSAGRFIPCLFLVRGFQEKRSQTAPFLCVEGKEHILGGGIPKRRATGTTGAIL